MEAELNGRTGWSSISHYLDSEGPCIIPYHVYLYFDESVRRTLLSIYCATTSCPCLILGLSVSTPAKQCGFARETPE